MKKPLLILPIVVLVGLGLWNAQSRRASEDGRLLAYGNIDVRNVNLAFRIGGRLIRVVVEEGDTVAPGDLLAEIDAEPQRLALEAAQAQLRGVEAQLAKLRAGFRPEEFEQARAAVAQAEAATDRAQREEAREEELAGTGASTPQRREAAETLAAEAVAHLRQAQAQLQLLEAGYRMEDIAQAEAEVASARAKAADAQRQVDDAQLTAPSYGVVQTRVVEPGTIVAPGQTVFNLALTQRNWARAYIPEPQLGKIRPGQKALIYTDTRPDQPYHGQVGFISPTAEFTPKNIETTELRSALVFRFHVDIADADDALRQGMPVTIRFED